MDTSIALLVFALVLLILRFIVGGNYDRRKIREDVERSGGQVVDVSWTPGFGGGHTRLYTVIYRTRDGKTMTTTCRTGPWMGVYWSGDSEMAGFRRSSAQSESLRK